MKKIYQMKKILLVGNVDGKFEYLFEKISLLSSKGQTFDCLFCIGNTLTFTFNIKPYLNKEKTFPIPTYFLDSSEVSFSLNDLFPEGQEIFENFIFLGRSGIKDIMGLKIAYLNGIKNETFINLYKNKPEINLEFSGCYYTKQDIDNLTKKYEEFKVINQENSCIDFFLTNEWPQGFENGLVEYPKSISNLSIYIANLANILNPRYHIVSLENIYFQRLPYINNANFMTRLIALAGVPDKNDKNFKEKYLYALQVTPSLQMDKSLLFNITEDATKNPYDLNIFKPKPAENSSLDLDPMNEQLKREEDFKKINEMTENCKIFVKGFDFRTKDDEIFEFLSRWGPLEALEIVYDPYTKKHKGFGFFRFKNLKDTKKALLDSNKFSLNGRKIFFGLEKNPSKPKSHDCWFCLSNDKTDKSLIFHIGNDIYLALDKGPISKRHIQIIPIDHYDKSFLLPVNVQEEIKGFKMKLLKMYDIFFDENLIFYERAVKLRNDISHMLIHCVPMPKNKSEEFIKGFEELAIKNKQDFFKMKENENLKDFCEDDDLFVYMEVFSGNIKHKFICHYEEKNQKFVGQDVIREMICEIFKMPERMKWKECLMSEQEKINMTLDLKRKLSEK